MCRHSLPLLTLALLFAAAAPTAAQDYESIEWDDDYESIDWYEQTATDTGGLYDYPDAVGYYGGFGADDLDRYRYNERVGSTFGYAAGGIYGDTAGVAGEREEAYDFEGGINWFGDDAENLPPYEYGNGYEAGVFGYGDSGPADDEYDGDDEWVTNDDWFEGWYGAGNGGM